MDNVKCATERQYYPLRRWKAKDTDGLGQTSDGVGIKPSPSLEIDKRQRGHTNPLCRSKLREAGGRGQ